MDQQEDKELLSASNDLSLHTATAVTFRVEFKKMIQATAKHVQEMLTSLSSESEWQPDESQNAELSALITVLV